MEVALTGHDASLRLIMTSVAAMCHEFMPRMIEEGHLYLAVPPLYRIDDVAVLERRPGTRLAQANVAPRVRSLTYDEGRHRWARGYR